MACWTNWSLLYSRTLKTAREVCGVAGARMEVHRLVSFSSSTGSTDLNSARQIRASFFAFAKRGIGVRLLGSLTRNWLAKAFGLLVLTAATGLTLTAFPSPASGYQITYPQPDVGSSISVKSDHAVRWRVGHYEVLHLSGDIQIQQQQLVAAANEAILWVEAPSESGTNGASAVHKVIVYLEGQAVIEIPRLGASQVAARELGEDEKDRIVDDHWLGRLFTNATVDLNQVAVPLGELPPPKIFARAQKTLSDGAFGSVKQVQFAQPVFAAPGQSVVVSPQTGLVQQITPSLDQQPFSAFGSATQTAPQPVFQTPATSPAIAPQTNIAPNYQSNSPPGLGPGSLGSQASRGPFNIQFSGRDSAVKLNLNSFRNPNNPNERVSVAVGGIRIVIDSPRIAEAEVFQGDRDRKLYILADNMVQWQTVMPDGTKRDQLYLEGNVVFAKGSRTIYAERMFYDVDAQQGTILKAEVLTSVKDYQGAVRMKADVVQQYDDNNLQAFGSAFTTSRLGVPRYWLQSQSIGIQKSQVQSFDPETGQPVFDPRTGLASTQDEFTVDSQQNQIYLGGVPVFSWPRLQTSLSNPQLYIDRLGVNNDSIFGFQLTTGWDMYQLLGLQSPPRGTRWIGLLDYLSERGVGIGSEFDYQRNSLFGAPGIARGQYKSWFINDDGLDFLGQDRRNLTPEEDLRGRIRLRHRHDFTPGYQLRAELGYITDRNFLEQYYEREWDTEKDATTGFWLERNVGTQSYNLTGDLQLNDFFTQTSGIKFDQFTIGQQVFNNRAIWHSHSHAGYVRMRQANAPLDPVEIAKFDPLAWEADVDGFRAGTRHELDFPTQFGPVKVIPYLLGDATYWQEDLTGNDLARVYGQVGIRASLPMWRVDPSVQSVLWNVNGLAHKVNFDIDAFYADASQDLDELPLYDPLDDDAQEHFRRRFAFDTFGIAPGGDTPIKYDERFFALRSGLQSWVTSPSAEIADDLAIVKLGVRQRWQTKRGMPGRERIIDWITLDMQAILFPDAQRDNFGNADFGMFDYDFRWHIGDRFSLESDGYFDFFSQGLRTVSIGSNLSRPEVGNVYVGFRSIEGPISSNILSAALTYRMSDKWGVKAGGQIDFGETGTIGQTVSFVYIGESFLWQFGANYDASRDNLGFRFGFEPRFTKRPRLFRPGGVPIPPAGSRWLE